MRLSFTKLVPSRVRQGVKSQAAMLSVNDRRLLEMCSAPAEKVLDELETSRDGLTAAGAELARERHGFNALSKKRRNFLFSRYWDALRTRWPYSCWL